MKILPYIIARHPVVAYLHYPSDLFLICSHRRGQGEKANATDESRN
jgi:hypothetical protein